MRSLEWVRSAAEYRMLAGKRELGCRLDDDDQRRHDELAGFFRANADPARAPFLAREMARKAISLIVTFLTGPRQEEINWGEACDISANGMYVSTDEPLDVGTPTIVRVIDRFKGDEFRFPAEVVRVERKSPSGMGVKFVGIPIALRVGHRRQRRVRAHAA